MLNMRSWRWNARFFSLITIISLCGFMSKKTETAAHVENKKQAPSVLFARFHNKGILTQECRDVFALFGKPDIETLEDGHKFAQGNLIRRGERWDKQDLNNAQRCGLANKSQFFEKATRLGLTGGMEPTSDEGTADILWLLLGATAKTHCGRQKNLEMFLYPKRMGRVKGIALMGGQRALKEFELDQIPEQDRKSVKTEIDMMRYFAYKSHVLRKALGGKPFLEIDAAMIKNEDGTAARPTTETTFAEFAKKEQIGGRCVIVSNGFFALRQLFVALRCLDQSKFPTECLADPVDSNLDIDPILFGDEFARTIYEVWLAFNAEKQ
jgi:hypothetical protein